MTGDLDWDCDVVDVERKPSAERSTANTVLLSRATTQLLNRPTDRSTQLLGACHGANDDDVMWLSPVNGSSLGIGMKRDMGLPLDLTCKVRQCLVQSQAAGKLLINSCKL